MFYQGRIILIAIVLAFIFADSAMALAPRRPLIGTSYAYDINPRYFFDTPSANLTHIKSFRYGGTWGDIEYMVDSLGGYEALADWLDDRLPDGVEIIFVIDYWHPSKMVVPDPYRVNGTYKVHPNYESDLWQLCYDLAGTLKQRLGVDYYVLHNEPNLDYQDSVTHTGPNWHSYPGEFAAQSQMCAEAIEAANQEAYIIYAGFAGGPNEMIGKFVNPIAPPETDNTILDAIDFHFYGNMYLRDVREAAHWCKIFCTTRQVDWSILETHGPHIIMPVNNACPANTDFSIKAMLIKMRTLGDFYYAGPPPLGEFKTRDSLYSWTRHYERNNLGLPEKIDSLQSSKRSEFNNRVATFVDSGAVAVHWFASYIVSFPPLDGLPVQRGDGDEIAITPEKWVEVLIGNAEDTPCNLLLHLDDYDLRPTLLSARMKYYIDSLYAFDRSGSGGSCDGDESGHVILYPNYPNVFNSQTEIRYYLPEARHSSIEIFNLLGQKVETLFNGIQETGEHSVIWDGAPYSSGIYFYRLTVGDFAQTKRMTLLK